LTTGGMGRGREADDKDWVTVERWRMTWAVVREVHRGNAVAMAIITLIDSKILSSRKFEYRLL
jgi:hypothetical protein